MNWVEWMNGICHIWSRGRLISPSMPVGDDGYLNLNSQKRPPGRNLGEHRLVRRSGATSRGTVVLVFCLRVRSFSGTEVLTMGRSICVGSSKNLTQMTKFTRAPWLQNVYLTVVWSLQITLITALPKAVLLNPLLLLVLQHQTYPSCEKESRRNTHNWWQAATQCRERRHPLYLSSPLTASPYDVSPPPRRGSSPRRSAHPQTRCIFTPPNFLPPQ